MATPLECPQISGSTFGLVGMHLRVLGTTVFEVKVMVIGDGLVIIAEHLRTEVFEGVDNFVDLKCNVGRHDEH